MTATNNKHEILEKFFNEEILSHKFDLDYDERIINEQIKYEPEVGDCFISADDGDIWTLENEYGSHWTVTDCDGENPERAIENWREVVYNYGPMVFLKN